VEDPQESGEVWVSNNEEKNAGYGVRCKFIKKVINIWRKIAESFHAEELILQ
jgi:hypothetical protein